MSLRIKLILITTAVVTVLFGISEWASYQQTAALLDQHEAILRETADHTVALEKLKATRERMFIGSTIMRLIHAGATLIIAVGILNYIWYRVIYRPIQRLLNQINIMGRGTWAAAIAVKRNDEIGQLTTAFNDLGQQLNSTFEHINSSSKLSALAFIGNRIMREVAAVRAQMEATSRSLESCPRRDIVPAMVTLTAAHTQLRNLEMQFEKEFDREFSAAMCERRVAPEDNTTSVSALGSGSHK